MEKCRWKGLLAVTAMLVTASLSSAATYVFDANDANWYEPGELTKTSANIRLISDNSTGSIYAEWNSGINAGGGAFHAGDYAAAVWTAPVGEIVTRVQMTGWYRADGDLSRMGYGLYAGDGSATTEYLMSQGGAEEWVGYAWSADVAIPELAAADTVEMRAWWHLGGAPSAVGSAAGGYWAYIDSITITTVPEPVTLTLLAMGGLAMARRRA